ncbi:MAG: hypothetical protein HW405_1010 [Candidatus Berkelbacteria bacterium]|nr:hypothetical protein [Candidatus Berkelbacteria bacterium]
MRVVIDTNIYLSGLVFPESFPGKILKLSRARKIQVYCSKFILDEIEKNLIIKFGYSEEMAGKFIEEILKFVQIVNPKIRVAIIKEKQDDNRILECAVEAKADFLISGDKKHLLPLKKFRRIEIVSAKKFIDQSLFG